MSARLPPSDEGDPAAPDPPDDDTLAGELVLGVLDTAGRRAAQAREQSDPAFAARIVVWEGRFAPWLTEIAPASAPGRVWDGICRRLDWHTPAARAPGLWQSLTLWRSAAVLAALAAFALWLTRPPVAPPVAVVPAPATEAAAKPVTTLAHEDGSPGWLASVDRTRGTVLLVPVPAAADAQGRVPELWIIARGRAPRSLGVVSVNKSHTVQVPPELRSELVAGSVLAITLEPAAGVPHASPTGPIIAKGAISS